MIDENILRNDTHKSTVAHWNEYYASNDLIESPSSFAFFVSKYVSLRNRIFELGYGNGRDMLFFSNIAQSYSGIDVSRSAYEYALNIVNKNNLNN